MNSPTEIIRKQLHVDDVAELMGCSPRHVRNLVAKGLLPHWRAGGRVLVDPDKLRAWIDAGGTKEAAV